MRASVGREDGAVWTGLDRVLAGGVELSRTARIGVLTNRAARTADGMWTGEALQVAGYRIVLFLTAEHGLDVATEAGTPVPHSRVGELAVLSLYGGDLSRVEEALSGLDALVVDLPDVGCRYYTYPWTVRELLQLAARHGLAVTLLDRPNPLSGVAVEGNVPDAGFDSAVCASPVAVRHGLTMGELALWNKRVSAVDVDLSVVPMDGWRREMLWVDTGLDWIAPSPALPSFAATEVYPGTCLLEGTNVSEGRGTPHPFQAAGAPFVDGVAVAERLGGSELLAGARVSEIAFVPSASKWAGERCRGVRIEVEDASVFRPVAAGVAVVEALLQEAGFAFRAGHFDALAGTSRWREALEAGVAVQEIVGWWQEDEERFRQEREEVLLYS